MTVQDRERLCSIIVKLDQLSALKQDIFHDCENLEAQVAAALPRNSLAKGSSARLLNRLVHVEDALDGFAVEPLRECLDRMLHGGTTKGAEVENDD